MSSGRDRANARHGRGHGPRAAQKMLPAWRVLLVAACLAGPLHNAAAVPDVGATPATGLEMRLGYPAGARLAEGEVRGVPASGHDGVGMLTLCLEIRWVAPLFVCVR